MGEFSKDWKSDLSEEEYRVMREKGTEVPFSGEHNTNFKDGVYTCKGCNQELFQSESKFDSSCGWPSFDRAIINENILEIKDNTFGMVRTEIVCGNCKSHLGHVFDDGPTDTRLRYCVNSISLDFKEK
jgi:peptide-methionine (R)-S-oxide reductase